MAEPNAEIVAREAIAHVREYYAESIFPPRPKGRHTEVYDGEAAAVARLTCDNILREFEKRLAQRRRTLGDVMSDVWENRETVWKCDIRGCVGVAEYQFRTAYEERVDLCKRHATIVGARARRVPPSSNDEKRAQA